MKRVSPPIRTPAKLSASMDRCLNLYTLTATAAGVGMMALAQPAQAKIVYTPAHIKFTTFLKLFVDVNHDGRADFRFSGSFGHNGSQTFTQFLWVNGVYSTGNAIIGTAGDRSNQASALPAGARIGPSQAFEVAGLMAQHTEFIGKHSTSSHWTGQWANGGMGVKNRYLGLKFNIKGKIHFGWARLTVHASNGGFTAILTGYAYETIPNKAIIAGRTNGPDNKIDSEQVSPAFLGAPTPEPATLGMLALGAQGVPLWRRKESVEPAQ